MKKIIIFLACISTNLINSMELSTNEKIAKIEMVEKSLPLLTKLIANNPTNFWLLPDCKAFEKNLEELENFSKDQFTAKDFVLFKGTISKAYKVKGRAYKAVLKSVNENPELLTQQQKNELIDSFNEFSKKNCEVVQNESDAALKGYLNEYENFLDNYRLKTEQSGKKEKQVTKSTLSKHKEPNEQLLMPPANPIKEKPYTASQHNLDKPVRSLSKKKLIPSQDLPLEGHVLPPSTERAGQEMINDAILCFRCLGEVIQESFGCKAPFDD